MVMKQKDYKILLKQHIGIPARPLVTVGHRVSRGECIADIPEDVLGAFVHSSVSGVVSEITSEYILVTADEEQNPEFKEIRGKSVIECIQNAGIAGMGGAGFPTHIKLKTPLKEEGMVILNAAECEPVLEHNISRILTDSEKILKGLSYAMEAAGAAKGVIGIKKKQTEAIEKIRETIKNSSITLHLLDDLYPMGEERALIREVTGTLLSADQLPLEANAAVINVETAYKIAEAVELKKPVITKDITIGGRISGDKRIQVIKDVPIGTTVRTILENAGGLCEDYGEIIIGGPFTGKSGELDEPITKTTGGIIVTMPFLNEKRNIGLLVCGCGASQKRMEEIAEKMGASIAGIRHCKQAVMVKGTYKCENPGKCPGQSGKVLELKKEGAQVLLIGNCSDCTNTVMSIAPKLKIPVYHITDGALRATGNKLIRKIHIKNEE